jgi:hypothetical protein
MFLHVFKDRDVISRSIVQDLVRSVAMVMVRSAALHARLDCMEQSVLHMGMKTSEITYLTLSFLHPNPSR